MTSLAIGGEGPPVLVHSRDLLLQASAERSAGGAVAAIEADLGLAVRTLRLANRGANRDRVSSVAEALAVLGIPRVRALAESVPVYDLFVAGETPPIPEQLRLHSLAVQRVAGRIAPVSALADSHDEIVTAALLHDVGKLLRWPGSEHERAAAGACLIRKWGLPDALADAVERHPGADGTDTATVIRMADLLAGYGEGAPVDIDAIVRLSEKLAVATSSLGSLMYELPTPVAGRQLAADPCPLSERELEVLRHLATGKVYKQIGADLQLSASTVRSHLHRIYTRIGAADRTQAVIVATERGWI